MSGYNTEHIPTEIFDEGGPDFAYPSSPELRFSVRFACDKTTPYRYSYRYHPAQNRKLCKHCKAAGLAGLDWQEIRRQYEEAAYPHQFPKAQRFVEACQHHLEEPNPRELKHAVLMLGPLKVSTSCSGTLQVKLRDSSILTLEPDEHGHCKRMGHSKRGEPAPPENPERYLQLPDGNPQARECSDALQKITQGHKN